jgi:hypothetical protein
MAAAIIALDVSFFLLFLLFLLFHTDPAIPI